MKKELQDLLKLTGQRLALSTMPKNVLEGHITRIKEERERLKAMIPPPGKRGPLPKRQIEIEEQEDDEGNVIRVPKAPAPRQTKPPPRPPAEEGKRLSGRPPKEKKEVVFEEREEPEEAVLPKGKSERVTVCHSSCGCPSCPQKKKH